MVKRLQKKERLSHRLALLINFLIIFNLLAIPLYIALFNDFSYKPLQELNADIVSGLLNFLGYDTHPDKNVINLKLEDREEPINISWDSTGWKSMYAVASLIIATPLSILSRRLKVALIAVGIVFFINLLRILTTIMISIEFGFNFFDIVHTVLWREGLILAVVGVWLLWMRMEKYNYRQNIIKSRWHFG